MAYIYYAAKRTDDGNLQKMLCTVFGKPLMKKCETLSEFSKLLHGPLHDVLAAVILMNNRKELKSILSWRDILWEMKLIIVFSGESDITQAEVMALHPRFLTWSNNDLVQVVNVLGKMMKADGSCGENTEAIFSRGNAAINGAETGWRGISNSGK